jgi:hypothetical protein
MLTYGGSYPQAFQKPHRHADVGEPLRLILDLTLDVDRSFEAYAL